MFISSTKATWSEAVTGCNDLGVKLATPRETAAQQALKDHAYAHSGPYWIGLISTGTHPHFKWSDDNELATNLLWQKNQPVNQPCVFVKAQGLFAVECDLEKHYVCQPIG